MKFADERIEGEMRFDLLSLAGVADRTNLPARRPLSALGAMMKHRFGIAMGLLSLAGLLATAGLAYAQSLSSATGKVVGYIPFSSGGNQLLFVRLDPVVSGGCNTTGRFVISSASPHFKTLTAGIMAAYHAGTPISVFYTQTCGNYGNSYDMQYACFGDIPC